MKIEHKRSITKQVSANCSCAPQGEKKVVVLGYSVHGCSFFLSVRSMKKKNPLCFLFHSDVHAEISVYKCTTYSHIHMCAHTPARPGFLDEVSKCVFHHGNKNTYRP